MDIRLIGRKRLTCSNGCNQNRPLRMKTGQGASGGLAQRAGTQVGFSRLGIYEVLISGKPEIRCAAR
jgi:hypothetical protein